LNPVLKAELKIALFEKEFISKLHQSVSDLTKRKNFLLKELK